MHEPSELPIFFKEEIMFFHALLSVGTLSLIMKVLAESLPVGLYIFPSMMVLRLHAVILLIVLLCLVLMVKVAILASGGVLSFWSSLMMTALIIVIRPSIIICDFLNRVIVVTVVAGKELASGTVFAGLFVLLDLLHLDSCIIIMEFV